MRGIEVYIEDNRLELFEAQSINITEIVQDVRDISNVFSDYTQQFNIPASDNNNKIFKHYYNYELINGFDARFRRDANIKIDGSDYKFGKMRLDGVEMKDGKPFSYKVVFFGSGVKMKDILGDFKLSDLTYLNNFNHTFDEPTVRSGLETGLALVNGDIVESADKDIVYPLISNAPYMFYDSTGSVDSSGNESSPSKNLYRGAALEFPNNGIDYVDLKPSIKLIRVIEAIENKFNGLRFSRDFFSKAPFNELYLHLHRDSGVMASPEENKVRSFYYTDFGSQRRFYTSSKGSGTNLETINFILGFRIEPEVGGEDSTYSLKIRDLNTGDVLESKDISGGEEGVVQTILQADDDSSREYELEYIISSSDESLVGFKAYLYYIESYSYYDECPNDSNKRCFYTNPTSSTYEIPSVQTFTPELIITSQVPEMTCIDFLTSLFKMYNLTAEFDELEGKVVVQTLKDYYLKGESVDITNFLAKDSFQIKKASLYSNIKFQYEEPSTFGILNQNTLLNDNFGDLEFETSNLTDPDTGNRVYFDGKKYDIKSKFEHLLYERLSDEANLSSLTNIQTGWLVDEEEDPVKTKPIVHFVVNEQGGNVGNIGFSGAGKPNFNSYFRASNVSKSEDFTINFGSESDEFNLNKEENSNGLFKRFYDYYISDLFNKKTRIFEFEAKVPNSFIISHRLNDLYVIDNRGYRADNIKINLNNGKAKFSLINTDFLPDNLPLTPNGLSIDNRGVDFIDLSWNSIIDPSAISYRVYVNDEYYGSVTQNFLTDGTPIRPTINIGNLEFNKLYEVRVSAVRDSIEGLKSAPLSFNLSNSDTTPPTKPLNLTVFGKREDEISVDWDDSTDDTGVTGYNVYLNGEYIKTVPFSQAFVSGLDNGVEYDFTVIAFDGAGNLSEESDVLKISYEAASTSTPPTSPSYLETIYKDSNSIEFRWRRSVAEDGVDVYNIYVNGILNGSTSEEYFRATYLTPNSNYEIEVEAVSVSGNSSRLSRPLSEKTLPNEGKFSYVTTSSITSFRVIELDGSDTNTLWRLESPSSVVVKQGVNPSFDLSEFNGLKTFSVLDDRSTRLIMDSSLLSFIDIYSLTNLTYLSLFDNNINHLNIHNNINLLNIYLHGNPLSVGNKDDIFTKLDEFGLSNGTLEIDLGRSTASDAAKASLISKGWSITEF